MKEIKVKLLVENNSGEFLLGEGFPTAEIDHEAARFQEAGKLATDLGLRPNSFQDMVRLQVVDDREREIYVIHVNEPEVDQVENHRWVQRREILLQDLSVEDSYLVVPAIYSGEYLSGERNYHEDVTEIDVVKPLIRGPEEKFLAVKKSHTEKISSGEKFKKYGRMAGKWELPGGRIGKKPGENRFEAAVREIKEELGIELTGGGRDVMREDIEENHLVKTFIVLYEDWKGEIDLSDSEEHSAYRWVTPREYLNLKWHQDAGYGYPPMEFLDHYLEKPKIYEET